MAQGGSAAPAADAKKRFRLCRETAASSRTLLDRLWAVTPYLGHYTGAP